MAEAANEAEALQEAAAVAAPPKVDDYVHLHVHSEYSLLDGYSRIEKLVTEAKQLGQRALAITDHGNMHGVVDFYKECHKQEITPVIGMEGYIVHDIAERSGRMGDYNHLLLFAENNTGYQNLLKLTTRAQVEGFYYKPRIDYRMLEEHHEGLIVTSGCLAGEIPQLFLAKKDDEAVKVAQRYYDIFGRDNFFIELQDHGEHGDQDVVNPKLYDLARKLDLRMIATNDLHYVKKEDATTQDIMLCVQMRKDYNAPDRMKFGSDEYYLKSGDQMREYFHNDYDELRNPLLIAERCQQVKLQFGLDLIPPYKVPTGYASDAAYLHTLVEHGLRERYGEISDSVRVRMEREFEIIKSKGFVSYFLIVWDYVNFARERGMRCVARGSVAGSVIAYALGMSNVDPLRYDIMFERFLNPERSAMPDIDIDFPDDRRGEVVRYVAEKYGWDKVAQIVTFNTMAAKAAIRDAGRVFNLRSESDRMARLIPNGATLEEAAQNVDELKQLLAKTDDQELDAANPYRRLIEAAGGLEGSVRNTGVHAAGVVISSKPLVEFTPCQLPRGKTKAADDDGGGQWLITQYPQEVLEELGLLKMDFLGLSNLSILQRTVKLIEQHHGVSINIDHIPVDDTTVYDMLSRGETTGIFQLESPNMRAYIKELKPSRLEDITAMVALYRPGPMDSIPKYIAAKHGGRVTYLHSKLEPILRETYGVLVYQDQVLLVANQLAGFSWGKVDKFRKAIGKKIVKDLVAYHEDFVKGCVANDIDKETAETLFKLIEPFGGYGFNKAHAASYALVAYQTAWLKVHYAPEFFAATLTTEAGDAKKVTTILEECRKLGIEVLPPDINLSDADFTVEGKAIRFGLKAVKGIGDKVVNALIEARAEGGPFASIADVFTLTEKFSTGAAVSLTHAGAFDAFGKRAQVVTSMDKIAKVGRAWRTRKTATGAPPDELQEVPEYNISRRLELEYEVLGFYVSGHPLDSIRADIEAKTTDRIAQLGADHGGRSVRIIGSIVEVKKVKTKKGDTMARIVVRDLSSVTMDCVVFASVYTRAAALLEPGKLIDLTGTYQHDDERQQILAQQIVAFAREKKAEQAKRQVLRVEISSDCVQSERMKINAQACAILQKYPGKDPFEVIVFLGGKPVPVASEVTRKHGITLSEEVMLELTSSFDKNSVTILVTEK